jgi:hypothetical protein
VLDEELVELELVVVPELDVVPLEEVVVVPLELVDVDEAPLLLLVEAPLDPVPLVPLVPEVEDAPVTPLLEAPASPTLQTSAMQTRGVRQVWFAKHGSSCAPCPLSLLVAVSLPTQATHVPTMTTEPASTKAKFRPITPDPSASRGAILSGIAHNEVMTAAASMRPGALGSKGGILRSTVRALLVPRRAIPIALVVVPMTIIQDAYSRDPGAVPIALLLCGSFLLVAPMSWRALFPIDHPIGAGALGRVVVYAAIGAAVVLGVGWVIPRLLGLGPTFMTTSPSLAVCLALFWVGGWGLARDIDLEDNLRRARARAEALAREADHAQLLALKSHLDPHFLFNTLNAIAEWCRDDGRVAERAILQLSSMLRTMMTGINTTTWPLAREIELVDALFALHSIRDPTLFTVEREVPDPLPDASVPPMVLLPLVENAMKHGPLKRHKGIVRFTVRAAAEGAIEVELSNPGAYDGPRTGGSGLPIVEKRLALAYGKNARFSIEGDGDRTRTRVVLPRVVDLSVPSVRPAALL